MRENLPVSQREYPFPTGATLMSTTDTQSHLTYANQAFIDVSGFTQDEIMGQPHNLVRHPDMPVEAFADMWATLKKGLSWTALVKNRRKNGDHYWVRANATPMRRNGQLTGYLSVRTQPEPQEVQAAETVYRRFREGKAGSMAFHHGLLVRTGWMGWTSLFQRLSVRGRIRLVGGMVAAMPLAAAGAAGVAGLPLAILGGALLASAVAGSAVLERQLASPLDQILGQAQAVASGEAGRNLHLDRVDEIGLLSRAINQAGLNLQALIDDVDARARSVDNSSQEIALGSMDLSSRTEEQASALEETAASMEELSSTVQQNASNAREGSSLAQEARTVALEGGEVVGQAVQTMKDIRASSRTISDIVGVIDGISFQTNILALNAAVESARAGEQGRGFAVVASEVRALAGRSSTAAKEIKQLIEASTARMEQGAALVDRAGATMTRVVGAIQRVSDIMGEISAASAEQSGGVSQIGEAISQMDLATQQNAAMVEESAAAAENLKSQADQLVGTVSVFKQYTAARPAPEVPQGGWGATHGGYQGVERRGPNRATNIARIHPSRRLQSQASASQVPRKQASA